MNKNKKFNRNCPSCNKKLYYVDTRNLNRAIINNSVCSKCKNMPKGWKENISKTLTGRKNPNYKRNPNLKKPFFRLCPGCGHKMWYKSKGSRKCAEDKVTLCNGCANIKYNRGWKNILTQDHRNKMAATKAGFSSYEDYMKNLSEIKKYRREVWRLTYKQPIQTLENFDKRGLCGVKGAYQIDHIISISEGFINKISPNKIANISNLRMIPWKQNLFKSNN